MIAAMLLLGHDIVDVNLDIHHFLDGKLRPNLGGLWELRVQIQQIQHSLEHARSLGVPGGGALEFFHLFRVGVQEKGRQLEDGEYQCEGGLFDGRKGLVKVDRHVVSNAEKLLAFLPGCAALTRKHLPDHLYKELLGILDPEVEPNRFQNVPLQPDSEARRVLEYLWTESASAARFNRARGYLLHTLSSGVLWS